MTYTTVYAKPVAVCQLQSKCLWLSCLQLGIANRFSNWRYVKQVLLRQQMCFDNHQAGTRRFFKRSAGDGAKRSDLLYTIPFPWLYTSRLYSI